MTRGIIAGRIVRGTAHRAAGAHAYAEGLDELDRGRRVLSCPCGRSSLFRGRIRAELDGWRPSPAPPHAGTARVWLCSDCAPPDALPSPPPPLLAPPDERAAIVSFLFLRAEEQGGKSGKAIRSAASRIEAGAHLEPDEDERRAAAGYLRIRAEARGGPVRGVLRELAELVDRGAHCIAEPEQMDLFSEATE